MNGPRTWFLCALAVSFGALLTLSAAAQAPAVSTTRRFALIVGANQGGKERPELRYAQRDARAVASVLEQLGGVEHADRVLLLEPSPEQLSLALKQLHDRMSQMAQAGQRTELLFYYSGHSDEQGLLLGEDRMSYRDLRQDLAAVGASVHVGVLDSCSSGALTRLKGGQKRAPFLLDQTNAVQGHAFLTSSSADEGAQESDRVGASFFTHYLVSGLRGAADFSGDGRVTLNEAYRFAFDETLARTEDTHAGPQHAAYDIQLVGTGDLVMTDLRQPAAALQLPKALSGRMYLRDSHGNLVVELNKPAGRVVELALDAQAYQVLLDQDGRLSRAGLTLPANTTTVLDAATFVPVEGERNRLRGDRQDMVAYDRQCRRVPIGMGLVPPYSTNSRFKYAESKPCVKNHLGIHALWGRVDQLEGISVSLGGNQVLDRSRGLLIALGLTLAPEVEGAQIAVGSNVADQLLGAQFAVGLNLVRERYYGLQGGLINMANEAHGAQLGLVNGAKRVTGFEAGLVNTAQSFKGLQAGLVNTTVDSSTDSLGLQLGLVNVSTGHVRGSQIGLVNYADKADSQFGLISVTRDGGIHPIVYASDTLPLQAGLRFDADHTFAFLSAGTSPQASGTVYGYGFGLGGKIGLMNKLWLEPTFETQYLAFDGSPASKRSTLGRLALNVRYSIYSHLSVFGGPSFQVLVHPNKEAHDERPGVISGAWELTNKGSHTQVLGTPGFVLGVAL
jgi:hypothetical protein